MKITADELKKLLGSRLDAFKKKFEAYTADPAKKDACLKSLAEVRECLKACEDKMGGKEEA